MGLDRRVGSKLVRGSRGAVQGGKLFECARWNGKEAGLNCRGRPRRRGGRLRIHIHSSDGDDDEEKSLWRVHLLWVDWVAGLSAAFGLFVVIFNSQFVAA